MHSHLGKPHHLILAALLFLVISSCAHGSPRAQTEGRVLVRFTYTDTDAKQVCLAGNFNQWSPWFDCLSRDGNIWTLDLLLPPGRYRYVFVIDGKTWKADPRATLAEDSGFGSKNSILVVE